MKTIRYLIITVSVFLILNCDTNFSSFSNLAQGIYFSEDKYITIKNEEVFIHEEGSLLAEKNNRSRVKIEDFEYTITHVAQISPVNIIDTNTQANDIIISGNTAFVAYNFAGETFRGALQIIDISNKKSPRIDYEIKFQDMDIGALFLDGSELYFGGAANPDVYSFRSFIGKLNTSKIDLENITDACIGLSSYTVTGIAKKGNEFYISAGALNGEIEILDADLTEIDSIELGDPRHIEPYDNGVITISGTTDNTQTNGKVIVIEAATRAAQEINIPDFNSPYHKSTIEVYEGTTALLGLSEAGFKVLDLQNNNQIIYELENPDPSGDLLPNCNSVSSDGSLIFTANGEYGFRVLRVTNKDFSNPQIAGYFPFEGLTDSAGQNYSANHIEYKSGMLFVASGVGGVNVYELTAK